MARDESAPMADRIAAGARLWETINRAKEALEPLKTDLRKEATRLLDNMPGVTTIEGTGMSRAVVTVPESKLKVVKGTDIKKLKKALGPTGFNALFEEGPYQVRSSTAAAYISNAPKAIQSLALAAITEAEGKPRVSFQFGGDVSPFDSKEDET